MSAEPVDSAPGTATEDMSKEKLPLISVIMASYNQGPFVREAIESVLTQTDCRTELILLDGGSSDNTLEVLESYGDRFFWRSEPDDGQSAAINEGFELATGDIYCWLNTDDTFTEGALAHVTKLFLDDPELAWIYGRGHNIAEDGSLIGFAGVREFDIWELIHHRNFINQPSTFWRASLWDEAGGLDVDLHYVMDWELWIRFAAYPCLFTEHPLSNNRVYDANKTQSGRFDRFEEIERMVDEHAWGEKRPVLHLYEIEAKIQDLRLQEAPAEEIRQLSQEFFVGMIDTVHTGRHSNGALKDVFHITVPGGVDTCTLHVEPLSRFVERRRGAKGIEFAWTSSSGASGSFTLEETGEAQQIELPMAAPRGRLEHFECVAQGPGIDSPGEDEQVYGYLLGSVPSLGRHLLG